MIMYVCRVLSLRKCGRHSLVGCSKASESTPTVPLWSLTSLWDLFHLSEYDK